MRRREFMALALAAVGTLQLTCAQGRPARIGILTPGFHPDTANFKALRQGWTTIPRTTGRGT